jgi:hypothetical protein
MTDPSGASAPNSRANPSALIWMRSEKKIARKAFDAALKRELDEVIHEAKRRAGQIKEPSELWVWSTTRHNAVKRSMTSTIPTALALTRVLGKLRYEGRLDEEQLRGLSQHQLNAIRSYRDFLADADATEPGT